MKPINEKNDRFPVFRERLNKLLGNMTIAAFAQKAGVTRQTMGFYLNGQRLPDALTLAEMCKNLNVAADWLIGNTDDPSCRPSAVNDLHLTIGSIDTIRNLSDTQRTGLELFLKSDLLPAILDHIALYYGIPLEHKFSPSNDTLCQYRNADHKERQIEGIVLRQYPELQGRFSVLYGVDHTEHFKQTLLRQVEMMLTQLDWMKEKTEHT